MAEIIKMPRMSDTMEEGVIVEWHKKVGDKVQIGELLAEIETDKATMDFESPQEGVLLHIGAEKGDEVPIEGVLAVIGKEGEDFKELLEKEKAKEKKGKKTAQKKEHSEETTEPEQTTEPEADEPEADEPKAETATEKDTAARLVSSEGNGRIKTSPLARRLAQESDVDITQVEGSGDEGRIIKRDIEKFVAQKGTGATRPAFVGKESSEDKPLSRMRKTIAKRLAASKFSAPHFYLTMEINMDEAIRVRKSINEELAPERVSFNDLVIKAAAMALRKHPDINASWEEDKISVHQHIHIGMAVAINEGLTVPVIKFADGKQLSQIAKEAKTLAGKAKEGKLKQDELQGNTFSVSNLGMLDIDEFTAIINPPDACIMAVGRINPQPVVKNGNIVIGNIMKVTLSCDHRVVDGAMGARFLQTFKEFLEDPVRMFVREF